MMTLMIKILMENNGDGNNETKESVNQPIDDLKNINQHSAIPIKLTKRLQLVKYFFFQKEIRYPSSRNDQLLHISRNTKR